MVVIPREICRDLDQALSREWIVTNGLGGYASSTITGANARRYHGLLVAALAAPATRVVMLAKIDEEVQVGGFTYRLGTNEYENGTIHPDGYLHLERVELDGAMPVFYYQSPQFTLTKTIWMEHGANTTYIRYTLDRHSPPIQLTLLPLCAYQEFHTELRGSLDWHFAVQARARELQITAHPNATPYYLLFKADVQFTPLDLWYWRFWHRGEAARGYEAVADLYLPGLLRATLRGGESIAIVATTGAARADDRAIAQALRRERARQKALTLPARGAFEKQLFLAADQFIIRRGTDKIILAGYPWLGERTRDTLLALEGLLLVTHRHAHAREILKTLARHIQQGMLPDHTPVDDAPAAYNNADTMLWYIYALDRYTVTTHDHALARGLFPTLEQVVHAYVNGTRHNIHVDPLDGLLFVGTPGTALTWMDARVYAGVVTPRIGKPVEINALWYRALRLMAQWAKRFKRAASTYTQMADRVRDSFARYWYTEGKYLYDVLDTPTGDDASLRPNQLFALGLADDLVPRERAEAVLEAVTADLFIPHGLRSLSPQDPHYHAAYGAPPAERDAAYHQGMAWSWLMGAYVDAYRNVFPRNALAPDLVAPFQDHQSQAGLGTVSEIFEPASPFRPLGCIAHAASVAQVLRIARWLG